MYQAVNVVISIGSYEFPTEGWLSSIKIPPHCRTRYCAPNSQSPSCSSPTV